MKNREHFIQQFRSSTSPPAQLSPQPSHSNHTAVGPLEGTEQQRVDQRPVEKPEKVGEEERQFLERETPEKVEEKFQLLEQETPEEVEEESKLLEQETPEQVVEKSKLLEPGTPEKFEEEEERLLLEPGSPEKVEEEERQLLEQGTTEKVEEEERLLLEPGSPEKIEEERQLLKPGTPEENKEEQRRLLEQGTAEKVEEERQCVKPGSPNNVSDDDRKLSEPGTVQQIHEEVEETIERQLIRIETTETNKEDRRLKPGTPEEFKNDRPLLNRASPEKDEEGDRPSITEQVEPEDGQLLKPATPEQVEAEPSSEPVAKVVGASQTLVEGSEENSVAKYYHWYPPLPPGQDIFPCSVCEQDQLSLSKLEIHYHQFHVNPRFLSQPDIKLFRLSNFLVNRHEDPSPYSPLPGLYRCHECFNVFDEVLNLKLHLVKHLPVAMAPKTEHIAPEYVSTVETKRKVLKRRRSSAQELDRRKEKRDKTKRKSWDVVNPSRPRRLAALKRIVELESEISDEFNSNSENEGDVSNRRLWRPQRECKSRTKTLVAISLAEQEYDKFDLGRII